MIRMTIPRLQSERLTLRAPDPSDFDAFAAFRGGARSVYVGGPFDRIAAFNQFCALWGHWDMRGFGRWIVAETATDTPVGVVGLFHPEDWPEPELAWSMFDGSEGKGYAFEAAQAARDHAFGDLNWDRLVSFVSYNNMRSIALAERLGAERKRGFTHPTYGQLHCYEHPKTGAV
ncbi:MAG: RimJ/RimL family protein N-acetyltransferase [Sulfitobacter sp.]|jgi:RimJ/RimL family protein N-acetyltransferase